MIDRFKVVREDLQRRYGHAFDEDEIDRIIDETIAEHEDARIPDFVPVLVEREASERLADMAEARGVESRERQEILYVCERNSGRSQLASAITAQLAGENVFFRSVGLNPEGGINPTVIQVLEERGADTSKLYQKVIVPRVVHTSDVVVLMGVDEIPGVPGHRVERWEIRDPEGQPIEVVREIADQVESHVRELLDSMGVPLRENVIAPV